MGAKEGGVATGHWGDHSGISCSHRKTEEVCVSLVLPLPPSWPWTAGPRAGLGSGGAGRLSPGAEEQGGLMFLKS